MTPILGWQILLPYKLLSTPYMTFPHTVHFILHVFLFTFSILDGLCDHLHESKKIDKIFKYNKLCQMQYNLTYIF